MPEPTTEQLQEFYEKTKTFTGLKFDTYDEFEQGFNSKFYTLDQIHKDDDIKAKAFGRTLGTITTGIKQQFDSMGIEITGEDLKQPIEKVVKLGLDKLSETHKIETSELQNKIGLTTEEKLKEFQEKEEKYKNEIKDYKNLLKEKATEFETLTNNNKQELKKFKLTSVYKDVQGAIKWNPDKDEYSKVGFLTKMKEKYVIDLDENEEPFIVDAETKSRIKAEGSHSTFMTPAEVYQMESVKGGMAAVNNKAGQKPVHQKVVTPNPPPQNNQPPAVRKRVMANTDYNRNVPANQQ